MRPYTVTVSVEADSPLEAVYAAGDILTCVESVEHLAALDDAIAIREVPS